MQEIEADEPEDGNLPLSRHAWRSILRTIFYAALILALLHWSRHGSSTVSALVTGLMFADYLTWLIRTLPVAFTDLLHGTWQTAVNVVAALLIYQVCGVTLPHAGEEVAVSFLAFLLVLALKVTYYAILWEEDEDAD